MNRIVLTLGSLLLLIAACNKPDSPVSAEEDLRSGNWRRTSGKVTYKDPLTRGDSTKDYLSEQPACRLDNSLRFRVNFEGTMELGAERCSNGEPDTKEFTWQITEDGKRISLYGVSDYFPINDVDADIITRTLGFLTIRYRVITTDPIFQTADTAIYTDVLRRN